MLLQELTDAKSGCHIGHKFAGALSYADDLVIMAPTLAGLQSMITVCEKYSQDNGISLMLQRRHVLLLELSIQTHLAALHSMVRLLNGAVK